MTLGLRAQTSHFLGRVAAKWIDFPVVLGKLALEFMQQVPAFSRLQTVPAVPAPATRPKLWVLFYVGTLLYLAQGQISQAVVQVREALRHNTDYEEAEKNLRVAKATDAQIFPAAHQ